jgi:hypothetical protein
MEDYSPTCGISIHKNVSLQYGRVYRLFEYYGIQIDSFPHIDPNPLVEFLGLYATDLILIHCKTPNGETMVFTQKEFLDPITRKIPLDIFSTDTCLYHKYYDISCDRYTGKVYLQGIMPMATNKSRYIHLIWKKKNGEYFYLSYKPYMDLDRSEKKFLKNLYPMSPDMLIDDTFVKLELD